MKKRLSPVFVILLLATLILITASCGKSFSEKMAEKIVEKVAESQGDNVDIDISGDSVSITNDAGESMTMGGSKLPDGWPEEVPFSKDVMILYSGATNVSGQTTWTVNGSYDGKAADIYDYYKSELAGWESVGDSEMKTDEGEFYTLQFNNGTYEMSMIVTGDGDETGLVINVSEME